MQEKKSQISESLVASVQDRFSKGFSETEIRKFIKEELNLGKTRANEIFREIKSSLNKIEEYGIQFVSDKMVYNSDNDTYILNLKNRAKPLVISGQKHRAICRAYSSFGEDMTANEVCVKFSLTPDIFAEYRKIFNLTKDREPLSAEEVISNTVEESAEAMLEIKRYSVLQTYERESWREIQAKAHKWEDFQFHRLGPFCDFLEGWEPPVYKPYKITKEKNGTNSLVIVLNDIHYGTKANEKVLVRGKQQTTNKVVDSVRKYGEKIAHDLTTMNLNVDTIVIVLLGDILNSNNPFGTTTKGTPLRNDQLGEEMFETAFDSLSDFIYNVSQFAPETKIYSYQGNHAGVLDSVLALTLSKYFRNQKNISFDICPKWAGYFVEKNTFFVCSHGAHDSIKAKAPKGMRLDNYIQSLIINAQENGDMKKVNSRVALFADLHHLSVKETNDFYYVLAPSMVGGDEYADALSLNSKPAQVALLINNEGVKSVFNYYF